MSFGTYIFSIYYIKCYYLERYCFHIFPCTLLSFLTACLSLPSLSCFSMLGVGLPQEVLQIWWADEGDIVKKRYGFSVTSSLYTTERTAVMDMETVFIVSRKNKIYPKGLRLVGTTYCIWNFKLIVSFHLIFILLIGELSPSFTSYLNKSILNINHIGLGMRIL